MHQFTSAVTRERDAGKLARLAEEMFRRFGGVDQFATAWHAAIQESRAHGKDCSALRSFRAIMEIVVAAENLNNEVEDARLRELARQGPEQLAEAQVNMAMSLIQQRPPVFREAASRLGLDLRPFDVSVA